MKSFSTFTALLRIQSPQEGRLDIPLLPSSSSSSSSSSSCRVPPPQAAIANTARKPSRCWSVSVRGISTSKSSTVRETERERGEGVCVCARARARVREQVSLASSAYQPLGEILQPEPYSLTLSA